MLTPHMRSMLLLPILALVACAESSSQLPLVGVDDPTRARPLESSTPAASSSAPAREIKAQGGAPLDGSVVPPGHGWFCFNTPSPYLTCDRSNAGCTRSHSDQLGPGIALGECAPYDVVYAYTRKDQDGTVRLYPYQSMEQCLSPVFGRKDDASGCAELR